MGVDVCDWRDGYSCIGEIDVVHDCCVKIFAGGCCVDLSVGWWGICGGTWSCW